MGAPFRILPRHVRSVIEAEIEQHLQRVSLLVARLDRADGDWDLEDTNDAEAIDEREPDSRGHCAHYGIDQTEPLQGYLGGRVSVDALA